MNNKEIWCDFYGLMTSERTTQTSRSIVSAELSSVWTALHSSWTRCCGTMVLNTKSDPASAEYILSGLYVDDLTTGGEDDDEPYKTRQRILASQPDGSPCVNGHQTKNSHWEDLKWPKGKWASWETRISSRRRSVLCKDHRRWSWRNRPHKGAQGPWNLLEPGIRHWCYEAEWDRRIREEPVTYKAKHSSNCS